MRGRCRNGLLAVDLRSRAAPRARHPVNTERSQETNDAMGRFLPTGIDKDEWIPVLSSRELRVGARTAAQSALSVRATVRGWEGQAPAFSRYTNRTMLNEEIP